MVDIRVSIDVFGAGLKITEIARVVIANQGMPSCSSHEDERVYEVFLLCRGNTDHLPAKLRSRADCTFTVRHRRSAGIWELVRKATNCKAFREFCLKGKERGDVKKT